MARRRGDTALVANEIRILALLIEQATAQSPNDLTKVALYGYPVYAALNAQRDPHERRISDATVYRCLKRLTEAGALVSEWESDAEAMDANREGRKRRYYHLTAAAAPMLEEEYRWLAELDRRPDWFRRLEDEGRGSGR